MTKTQNAGAPRSRGQHPIRGVARHSLTRTLQSAVYGGVSALSLIAALGAAPASAQTILEPTPNDQAGQPPPPNLNIDARGVDLATGSFFAGAPSVSVGPDGGGGLTQRFLNDSHRDTLSGGIQGDGTPVLTVSVGGFSEMFTSSADLSFSPLAHNGSTLIYDQRALTYTYTTRDGSRYTFARTNGHFSDFASNEAYLIQVVKAMGETLTYHYAFRDSGPYSDRRLQSVTNNRGYMVHYDHLDRGSGFFTLTGVKAINTAVDWCDPNADVCSNLTVTWPSLVISDNSFTDALNRTTSLVHQDDLTDVITYPGGRQVTIYRQADGRVANYAEAAGVWNYHYESDDSSGRFSTTVTSPMGHERTVSGVTATGLIDTVTDELGHTTSYAYDTYQRLYQARTPEGVLTQYDHDDRGNIGQVTVTPKAGSGQAPQVTLIGYSPDCTNTATCNLPNYVVDARGHRTDYEYNPDGTLKRVTSPADDNNVHPETRYTYLSQTALTKDASGALISAGPAVSLLQQTSSCTTGSSCLGTEAEAVTLISYDNANRLPSSVTVTSGTNNPTVTSTTALTYDAAGDLLTSDGPLPGAGDTTRYRYDDMRQLTAVIDPDPDGGGAEKPRARSYEHDGEGRVSAVHQGLVNSQADADWPSFHSLTDVSYVFDSVGRRATALFSSPGGPQLSLLQYGYDADSRLTCSTVRMNPATWGQLPDGCILTAAGADGPDRITRFTYDDAGRLKQTEKAYGTSYKRVVRATSYFDDGEAQTDTDANGNVTTYAYDGFDRLRQVTYPTPSNGSVPSGSDYETYQYDANSNVMSLRRRDGQVIGFEYDGLNRLTHMTSPDRSFSYDNRGLVTSATSSGASVATSYDVRGSIRSQTSGGLTLSYDYDEAARRKSLTWPGNDAFAVTYQWDAASKLQGISEGGSPVITFAYNGRDQRSLLSRANGAQTTYDYDGAGRLQSYAFQLPSGTGESFTLTRNAAGQIRTRTGDTGAWDAAGPAMATATYQSDALNRYTSVNGTALAYDGQSNTTQDASGHSFGYDAIGELTSANGGALVYDGLGRLVSEGERRFVYDGNDLVAEYGADGGLVSRYVHGPREDEPLIDHEVGGSGQTHYLVADINGSIVGSSSPTGLAETQVIFDDYGRGNPIGRFGFEGKNWISSSMIYDWRYRSYSPALGRFLQPDPIGYTDGLNRFRFVGNDPRNGRDPSGLGQCQAGISYSLPFGASDPCDSARVPELESKAPGASGAAVGPAIAISVEGAGPLGVGPAGGGATPSPNRPAMPHDYQQKSNACSRATTPLTEGLDKLSTYTQRAAGSVAVVSLTPQLFGGPVNPIADAATGAGEALAGVLEIASLSASAVSGGIQFLRGNGVPAVATVIGALLGPASGITGTGSHVANTLVGEAATSLTSCPK